MRIIGTIEHPSLKISVFRSDQRISVKFENALYEQTFKLGADERLDTLDAVRRWVDTALIEAVQAGFREMHRARMGALERAFPQAQESLFEQII
ncbi:MAG TPA: hypothetical protein PK971_04960 [Saprospiraceae bacterium]|nr:hypothetical protein [Saprospiraceae bacterium]HNG90422.1 hypothetical protein [Saprospiraceae bacterium]